jgi:hypothetical protein
MFFFADAILGTEQSPKVMTGYTGRCTVA